MQRKRNTKGKCRYSNISSTTIIHRLLSSLYNLHSIPKLLTITTNSKTMLKNNSLNTNSIKNVKSNILYSIPSVVVLVFLFGLIMTFNPAASSFEAYASIETKGDSTASMTLDTSDVMVDVAPGSIGYASKDITIKAANTESYTLAISSSTGLVGPSTMAGAGDNNTIDNMPNNSWGYSYGDYTNANASDSGSGSDDAIESTYTYSTITNNTTVLDSGTNTSTNPNGIKKTLSFAAKFSDNAIPGHYIAEVTLSLAATPKYITYNITYNMNGSNSSTTLPNTTCTVEGVLGTKCTTNLANVTPTTSLSNMAFFGWSTNKDSHSPEYTVNSSINVTGDTTLYAIWKDTRTISQISYMQDMNWGICYNTAIERETQLKDARDNKDYWVTKLADNNCWMVQNLDFDVTTTLSNTTSDINETSQASDTIKVTSISSWAKPSSNTYNAYYDPGDYYYLGLNNDHAFSSDCPTNIGLSKCSAFSTSYADKHYHVGNYYSFSAVTAKSSDGLTTNATQSICPKGWTLPMSNGDTVNGSFGFMLSKYGLANTTTSSTGGVTYAIYSAPLYFVYGGFVAIDYMYTASGYLWSSTPVKGYDSLAYGLLFSQKNVSPTEVTNGARYNGRPARCIARN